jgi:predicted component of type VI protein secretion system
MRLVLAHERLDLPDVLFSRLLDAAGALSSLLARVARLSQLPRVDHDGVLASKYRVLVQVHPQRLSHSFCTCAIGVLTAY